MSHVNTDYNKVNSASIASHTGDAEVAAAQKSANAEKAFHVFVDVARVGAAAAGGSAGGPVGAALASSTVGSLGGGLGGTPGNTNGLAGNIENMSDAQLLAVQLNEMKKSQRFNMASNLIKIQADSRQNAIRNVRT